MARVAGIDLGTISLDVCALDNGRVFAAHSLPTAAAMSEPGALVELLRSLQPLDLIVGPSGYGLPLVTAANLTETDITLAALPGDREHDSIPGFRRLLRAFAATALPLVFTPGVVHLPSVPAHRKVNRIDIGTADKVCAAALAIHQYTRSMGGLEQDVSLLFLEIGGAFSAALAVEHGAIVDGVGGTSGPIGLGAAGALDGEVAFVAGTVSKSMLFRGGINSIGGLDSAIGREALVESTAKAVAALSVVTPGVRDVFVSGRLTQDHAFQEELRRRLAGAMGALRIHPLQGFAADIKQGAQGAALIADGLAGGACAPLVRALRLEEATGTVLDHLHVISPDTARRKLGIR